MKALLIDPVAHSITEVTVDTWRDIAPALGCSMFDVVRMTYNEDLYIDDEGLFEYPNPRGYFAIGGQLFAGRGIVLGHDQEGNSVDTRYNARSVGNVVEWRDTPVAEECEPRLEVTEWA